MFTTRQFIIRSFSIVSILILTACGGSGSDSVASATASNSKEVVIQGIVSDDPVEGATVTFMSLPNKEVLTTAVTSNTGAYSTPPITDTWLSNGYYITASGGISQGKPFVGQMRAVYGANNDYSDSHVTLLTTAVTKAAEATTTDLLQLHAITTQLAETAVLKGVFPPQWTDVDVAAAYSNDESAQIARLGVNNFTDQLGYLIDHRLFIPQDGTVCVGLPSEEQVCSTHVGPSGGTLRDQSGTTSGNVIAEIPSPELPGCEYIVHARIVNKNQSIQSITVSREVASATLLKVSGCANAGYLGDIVIRLPPSPTSNDYQVANITDIDTHSVMEVPQTIKADIKPGLFITDGETHRVKNSFHRTKTTRMVTIERAYGSNLHRKMEDNPLQSIVSHPDAISVLFIHGFSATLKGDDNPFPFIKGETFGGHDATWGQLPQLVSELTVPDDNIKRFEPYNFQWTTDASFYDVAKDLAKAIKYAYGQSGNQKIHVIAHSFGGVLARVTLEKLFDGSEEYDWSTMVATLTTVGTPHSGTSGEDVTFKGNDTFPEDVKLPIGWDSPVGLSLCKQVSCYQTGLPASIEGWMKTSDNLGADAAAGYLIADLENNLVKLPDGLRFQVLIGQTFRSTFTGRAFENGDRLISFYGQRLTPASTNSPKNDLLYEEPIGGAYVTERILGVNHKIQNVGFPGDLIDFSQMSSYANLDLQAKQGYAHTKYPSNLSGGSNLEVNIPSYCKDPDNCKHDTWVNIRDLLLSMHGGPPSPNFENTTGLATEEAPTSISGKTIKATITSGSGGFATTGTSDLVTSNTTNQYTINGDMVNVANSAGTFSYSSSGNKGIVAFDDSALGKGNINLTFTSTTSGTFTGDLAQNSSANQTGTFIVQ
jgi:pimeloyl-ACP methyl ester carboxylesterase